MLVLFYNLFFFMAKLVSSAFLVFFFFAYFGESRMNDFVFNGFNRANLSLDGSSIITANGLLQLTNQSQYVVGHAFYPSPINMFIDSNSVSKKEVSSFSTSFVFGIIPSDQKRGGGHGFAFAISPLNQLSGANPSHFLGLFNPSNDGSSMNHVFAVEFDTVGASGAFGDPDSNHVGVDVNGLKSLYSETASYYEENATSEREEIKMESAQPIKVWIEYDGVHKLINVTLSPLSEPRPSKPLLSKILNLSSIFNDSMYVGFSASTGKLSSSHYILGWSFRVNGSAEEIELSRLPLLPQVEGSSSSNSKRHVALVVIPVTFSVLAVAVLLYLYRLRRKRLAESLEDWELDAPHRFRYKDLYIATKGFKESEIIGVGGFGAVYKGMLATTSEQIAVKRISQNSMQGVREFVAEIESLGRLRHKNLVHLLGWCKRNDDLLLVYDFVPNGSLDLFLRNDNFVLSWERRFKIIKGIASALVYLHQDWEQVVVHRDIKASNVLLDVDMNGRLGDFGLARLYDHGENPCTTRLVGTLGYIAPELARTGKATARSDVFSYGTLLLVVATGKGPIAPSLGHTTLLDWVADCYRAGRIMDVGDPKLQSSYVIEEVDMVLKLGLLCSHPNPESRPSMRQVTRFLDGDDLLPTDVVASVAYLHVDSVKSVFGCMDPTNVITDSQSWSIGPVSSNSLEDGR